MWVLGIEPRPSANTSAFNIEPFIRPHSAFLLPDTINLLHRDSKSPVDPNWPLLSLSNTTLLTLAAVVVGTGAPRRRWEGVGRWARAQSSDHLHDIGHDHLAGAHGFKPL